MQHLTSPVVLHEDEFDPLYRFNKMPLTNCSEVTAPPDYSVQTDGTTASGILCSASTPSPRTDTLSLKCRAQACPIELLGN